MNVVVRPASAKDGPALYRAWNALRQHYATLDRRIRPAPVAEAHFLADLAEMLARGTSAAFVAEVDRRLVGFLSGGLEESQPDRLPERHATVGYLYVDPGFRRRGVGRKLFEAMVAWAGRHEGVTHVEMPVLDADIEAALFWQALGFQPYISRLWAALEPEDEG